MYNKELNDIQTQRLADEVVGKRVLLVGNAASLFSDDRHGEMIESYDFIVRFGKGFPPPKFAQFLGQRTDMWFFGPGRAGMATQFQTTPWKVYTPSQMKVYEGGEDCIIPRSMLDGSLQIYRDFFMTGPAQEVFALNKMVNGEDPGAARLSQGIQCIHWFYTKVNTYASLNLIGFDFFEQEFSYDYDNSRYPHIPRTQPTTSWHCPLISKQYTANPHAFSTDSGTGSNEKKYILSLPLNHIKMPPLNLDTMTDVLKGIRGKNSTITTKR